jgi:hypothetical protein
MSGWKGLRPLNDGCSQVTLACEIPTVKVCRENSKMPDFAGICKNSDAKSVTSIEFPYATEQGRSGAEQGKFWRSAGKFLPKQGKCRENAGKMQGKCRERGLLSSGRRGCGLHPR